VFYLDNLAMISIFTPKYGVVQVRLWFWINYS
jgi:hypothetical protein